jgi:hypothetical protein
MRTKFFLMKDHILITKAAVFGQKENARRPAAGLAKK